MSLFQSTHPLRGATGRRAALDGAHGFQSTHPLRGATYRHGTIGIGTKISIHAPLAGCDLFGHISYFKSTYFNPRTPCGVRPQHHSCSSRRRRISIHAPLAGCDGRIGQRGQRLYLFQSTHPLRGATAKLPKYSRQICEKATKFLQSRTKSGVAACWAKGKRLLFPTLRGANLPEKTGTLPVRIR